MTKLGRRGVSKLGQTSLVRRKGTDLSVVAIWPISFDKNQFRFISPRLLSSKFTLIGPQCAVRVASS